MSQKASIGFALIVKDGAKTLEPCLKSIRPYVKQIVVGIDTLSTDATPKIAKKYADVVVPITVSEEHECAAHGRIMAQHFARARNESFKHLDPDLDFWAWIDADDVLEGAHLLPELLGREIPPQLVGFWGPYWYGWIAKEDGTKVPNTVFDRERILRTHVEGKRVDWQWESRVHETVRPANIEHPTWAMEPRLRWLHQHQAHKSSQSGPRNLALLEIELEERPNDPRTVYYMGNTYFAMGDWANAAQWYENYSRLPEGKNPYELWQSYVYMSLAYEQLHDLDASLQAAFGAIHAVPYHPEPYYRLASLYYQFGEDQKVIYWTKEGDKREDAPFFSFKNPMERDFNKYLPLADSLLRLGHLSEARKCLEEAVKTFPDERVKENLSRLEKQEMAEQAASDFVGMAKMLPEDTVLSMYEQLPDAVKTFGRTRNIAMTIHRQRRRGVMPSAESVRMQRPGDSSVTPAPGSTQPRIIFWCGRSLEPWAPPTLTKTGIGGSETAVVEIARRFAKAGWLVDVYNGADYMEGVYDGVGYWDPERLGKGESCDVFVSWRDPRAHSLPIKAKQKVLWCHDLNYGPDVADDFKPWDIVLGVSGWHANMLHQYYTQDALVGYVPNGIDLSRFEAPVKKVPFRCVYASSPDRGLDKVLAYWPSIIKGEPEAELHIAYGWDNIDKMISQGRDDLIAFRDEMTRRIEATPNVVWRGRLPQDELAKLYSESYLWLYPCDFLEVSCISAMEAMAGGAVPVATKAGALPETVGEAGLLVPGPPSNRGFGDTWSKAVAGLLTDTQMRLTYAARGRERAKDFSWDSAFSRWLDVLGFSPHAIADCPGAQSNGEQGQEKADVHAEMVAA